MIEDLRGVFFIMKGQYRRGLSPTFFNTCLGVDQYLGGFNPESRDTTEWYMLVDTITWHTQCANSDYEVVLRAVEKMIKKYKTRKHFEHVMNGVISRNAKSVQELDRAVYEEWGDYFKEDIEEEEDLAYEYLRDNTRFNKTKKKMRGKVVGITPQMGVVNTPEVVVTTPKRGLKLKRKTRK